MGEKLDKDGRKGWSFEAMVKANEKLGSSASKGDVLSNEVIKLHFTFVILVISRNLSIYPGKFEKLEFENSAKFIQPFHFKEILCNQCCRKGSYLCLYYRTMCVNYLQIM